MIRCARLPGLRWRAACAGARATGAEARGRRAARDSEAAADAGPLLGLAAAAALGGAAVCAWRGREGGVTASDRQRLRQLVRQGSLLHPMGGGGTASFADLAHALSSCCGLSPERPVREAEASALAREIGGQARRHIVVVLCDGMGNSVLEEHLEPDSFLRRNNQPGRLVAIFPATTPAALTTLATGAWPGQHGQPGWDLRDQKGCEYPCKPVPGPVQLRVLHQQVTDMRSNRPAAELGYTERDIYSVSPWTAMGVPSRRMFYISAYNGTGFTTWYEGPHSGGLSKIPETAAETLGAPEGSAAAVAFFRQGVDTTLAGVAEAEREGRPSYSYLYTAHPDKHMHALGVEHPEVRHVVRGIDAELTRLWRGLEGRDAALVVVSDHSHLTVAPEHMVSLPDEVVECLEYANIGVLGKGRHGVLHVRSGRRRDFEERWAGHPRLRESFLLLTVEDAVAEGLFGPDSVKSEVRPRLGDYIAVSVGRDTLVSPDEAAQFRDCPEPRCQGAHGSLCREELSIPFVLCTAERGSR